MIDLERSLEELAERLEIPGDEWMVADVLRRIAEPTPRFTRRRRLPILAGAVVALAVLVVVVLPGPRHAVGRWLGFDSVRIEPGVTVPTQETSTTVAPTVVGSTSVPPPAVPDLGVGPSLSIDEAMSQTGLPDPAPSLLGEPLSVHVVHPPRDGQILVVYAPSDLVPQSSVTGVGALVSVFEAHIEEGFFRKTLGDAATVRPVRVGDGNGYWIEGSPHQLMFEIGDDEVQQDTLRLATNTLLWERNGLIYRIEADVSLETAVKIAESIP